MVGKWGQLPLGPAEFGFDFHLRYKGSGTYWNTQERGKSYTLDGVTKDLGDGQYLPDLMHEYVVDFMTRHRERPFYVYYSLSHVHTDILPTPDSARDSKDLYKDNVHYMDKLVGKLTAALDRLELRKKTVIVFVGDNGTSSGQADRATIGGRRLSGEKGSMLEAGANVPMIVSWPGHAPAGKVSKDLVDSTDFLPTFAELAGARLPEKTVIDGRSFAPQLQGKKGKPREWVFIQLARKWYVRDEKWKLNQDGELFDMSGAPFTEPLVPASGESGAAKEARRRLGEALQQLNPAGGILDTGDGTGRHAGWDEKKKRKK
jgi:arylsulfatase A